MRGAVKGDIPPEIELGETAVASYGAATVAELLAALAPETGTGRGRGSGAPVVLLNGRRIAGFAEIRELPTEAIERVQILPEEVALKFGYSADQRVVNFILKDNFRAKTALGKLNASTAGARFEGENEATYTKVGKQGRFNLSAEYKHDTPVREDQRNIVGRTQTVPAAVTGNVFGLPGGGTIDAGLNALFGAPVTIAALPALPNGRAPALTDFVATANQPASTNIGSYRTLLGAADDLKLNGTVNRVLSPTVSVTVNATYELNLARSLLGLPSTLLTVAPEQPFSPFGGIVGVSRGFAPALTRDVRSDTLHGALTFDGDLRQWQWTVTGTFDRSLVKTSTDAGIDTTALRAHVSAGAVNPFGPLQPGRLPPNSARNEAGTGEVIATASGPLFKVPGGPVRATLRGGGATTTDRADTDRGDIVSASSLSRREGNAKLDLDLPLTSRKNDVLAALGNLTLNGNLGLRQLSDFGQLVSFGYGLNWSPKPGMTILASTIDSNNEPSVQQLGNPVITTPNVAVYDFSRGENALVTSLSGGNRALLSEKRRDYKLGLSFQPPKLSIVTVSVNYFHNHSTNPVAGFPTLTPVIEAAYPARVVRDAGGRLGSIDVRPINFAETRSEVVRVGFNLSREFGNPASRPDGAGGGRPGGGGRAQGGGDRPGGGFRRNDNAGGRWNLSLYDSVKLEDQVVIAPGQPVLNLLNGSAIGTGGGSPRHSVELEGGWFDRGLGIRGGGNFTSGSMVDGSTAAATLAFASLLTLNIQAFVSFDGRPKLIAAVPFLKAARLSFAVSNLTGAIRRVRDATGAVPISYQPGYLDPRGRVAGVTFRKRF